MKLFIMQWDPLFILTLLILFILSLFSWAIIFSKTAFNLRKAQKDRQLTPLFRPPLSQSDIRLITESTSGSAISNVVKALLDMMKSTGKEKKNPLFWREQLSHAAEVAITTELDRLGWGQSFLATIASTSPFIGLFGTIFGVIDAFRHLGISNAATLKAVAPGIASALIATAAGLAVAIPALLAFNFFSNQNRISEKRIREAIGFYLIDIFHKQEGNDREDDHKTHR